MRHCMMYFAGYKHLTCDRMTHTHRLLNLHTGDIEIWEPTTSHDHIGIPYKNTFLRFKDLEENIYGEINYHQTTRFSHRPDRTRPP